MSRDNMAFFQSRRAGILLHPTSLPRTPGNGDLGAEAYRFVDFLANCGISLWQMLPLGPPDENLSPYRCLSVHATNPLLISLDRLVEKGWLQADSTTGTQPHLKQEIQRLIQAGWCIDDPLEYELATWLDSTPFQEGFCPVPETDIAIRYRRARLKEARAGFEQYANPIDRQAYAAFKKTHAYWLEDYGLFRGLQAEHHQKLKQKCLNVLKTTQNQEELKVQLAQLRDQAGWWEWVPELRDRYPNALKESKQRLANIIEQHRFEQFVFFNQWQDLKTYAHKRGVYLFGDIPIFVAEDSADVWTNRQNFQLNAEGRQTIVAGVPPDYFSATGQRWGNPHYDWEYMQANGFIWWIDRLKSAEVLFDVARVDHFRGFEACWAIQASCETAIEGEWIKVPGEALFEKLQQVGTLPLVAEDLGIITDEVKALRDKFGFPGMRILQFAFSGEANNPYLPHNHIEHCVVYTGTHDNNTTLGWFQELPLENQKSVCDYLQVSPNDMPWALVESAFASVAKWAIIPLQDVLGLDDQHRMNRPGIAGGNWRWRFDWSQFPKDITHKLRQLVQSQDRSISS